MAISRVFEDSWTSENYGLPSGLYFYFLSSDVPEWNNESMGAVLGNCPAIQSIQYTPFINVTDITAVGIEYDTDRFGKLEDYRVGLTFTPVVWRINSINTNVKELGSFKCYNPTKTIGGERNWRNESRLYNYPYMFAMLTDNLNTPIEIKYHLCPNNLSKVKVRNTISDRCSYGLFIEGYKGDNNGQMESMVSGDAHELPSSSSAYSQWIAANKNQVRQNISNASSDAFMQNSNLQNQLLPSLVNNFNPTNPITTVSNMYLTSIGNSFQQNMNNKNVQNQIASVMAQTRDLRSTPNTMISMGSDVYYGLDKGNKKVHLFRYGLTEEFYKKLGDYFAMYGYKQNRVFNSPNTRSRYYYNYIKTVGVNLNSSGVPRQYLEKLKSIYDNGVTIWHIDREGVQVGNYSKDNYEV